MKLSKALIWAFINNMNSLNNLTKSYKLAIVLSTIVLLLYLKSLKISDTSKTNNSINIDKLDQKFQEFVLVTRIHAINSISYPDISIVKAFIKRGLTFSNYIIICVKSDDLTSKEFIIKIKNLLNMMNITKRVHIVEVSPWGKFVTSLNVAILQAVKLNAKYICFQSLEFQISVDDVNKLIYYFDDHTVVVGPALPGHDFKEGLNRNRGRVCPWNTFAIWSLDDLYKVGFLPISDGTIDDLDCGGVEEVATINVLFNLYPNSTAKLVQLKNIKWNTEFTDESRATYHAMKMQSKDSRPEKQLKQLGIQEANILHIIDN